MLFRLMLFVAALALSVSARAGTTEDMSKIVAFTVLNSTGPQLSKVVGFVVLCDKTAGTSDCSAPSVTAHGRMLLGVGN